MRIVATAALTASVAGSLIACSSRPAAETPAAVAPDTGSGGPVLNGTYTFTADGRQVSVDGTPRPGGIPSMTTWDITPCGPACSHVTSSLGWSADLRLDRGSWRATRELPMECHGTTVTSSTTYVLDATTLTGTATNEFPCGTSPIVVVVPATLTKK